MNHLEAPLCGHPCLIVGIGVRPSGWGAKGEGLNACSGGNGVCCNHIVIAPGIAAIDSLPRSATGGAIVGLGILHLHDQYPIPSVNRVQRPTH
jgi:hypothetical protein